MKKILQIAFWMIIFAGIMVIFGFAVAEQKKVTCTGLEIKLNGAEKPGFIDTQDIRRIILQLYNPIEGRILDSINTELIARELNRNPYLKDVSIIKTLSGLIKLELSRTEAMVRVVNTRGDAFYLSTEGYVMPISLKYIPKTLIVTGFITEIPDPYAKIKYNLTDGNAHDKSVLPKIHLVAGKLANHLVFNRSIEQVYVTNRGEFEMIPASGNHIILLGDADNLDHKLENLLAFYQAGMPKLKEEDYKIVDLKYKDQVVCKKTMQ